MAERINTRREAGESVSAGQLALLRQLERAKASGYIHKQTMMGIAVFGTGAAVDDPYAVMNMPLDIRLGFRRKVFGIWVLQILAALAVMCVLLFNGGANDALLENTLYPEGPYNDTWIACGDFGPWLNASTVCAGGNELAAANRTARMKGELARFSNTGVLCFAMLVSLGVLYCAKYTFPINFVALVLFTFLQAWAMAGCAGFFGMARLGGPLIFSVAFMAVAVLVMTALSTKSLGGAVSNVVGVGVQGSRRRASLAVNNPHDAMEVALAARRRQEELARERAEREAFNLNSKGVLISVFRSAVVAYFVALALMLLWPVEVPRNTWLQRKRCVCTATAWIFIAAESSAIP